MITYDEQRFMAAVLQWLKIWANAKAISSNPSRGDRGTTEVMRLLYCVFFVTVPLIKASNLKWLEGVPAIKQKFTLN